MSPILFNPLSYQYRDIVFFLFTFFDELYIFQGLSFSPILSPPSLPVYKLIISI